MKKAREPGARPQTLRGPQPVRPQPQALVPEAKIAPAEERKVAFKFGISAESRAAALLVAKGFRILARRWRSPAGEIDIVARRRALLVFIEVKARATIDGAAESVTVRQRRRIAAAAEAWLAMNPDPSIQDIRFDVMLVAPGRIPVHIPAAFDAE